MRRQLQIAMEQASFFLVMNALLRPLIYLQDLCSLHDDKFRASCALFCAKSKHGNWSSRAQQGNCCLARTRHLQKMENTTLLTTAPQPQLPRNIFVSVPVKMIEAPLFPFRNTNLICGIFE